MSNFANAWCTAWRELQCKQAHKPEPSMVDQMVALIRQKEREVPY